MIYYSNINVFLHFFFGSFLAARNQLLANEYRAAITAESETKQRMTDSKNKCVTIKKLIFLNQLIKITSNNLILDLNKW